MTNNYIITIARTFGSNGKEIALKLSEELGIPCYDNQIPEMASLESGINEELFFNMNHKLKYGYTINWLKTSPTNYIAEPYEKRFASNQNLFNIQSQIIRELAKNESCIILGKCADYVLEKNKNVVRIFIDSPENYCVDSVTKKMNVTYEKATQLVKKTNKYRSDYYKFYTNGRAWLSTHNYDLMINVERVGKDLAVKTIKEYVANKFS